MDARQRWTLILTSVASLMVGLDLTVVTTALNTIRLDLGASIAELDWTINAYTLTIGVLLLTAAAAGPAWPPPLLVAGLTVFTASSAACALAPSIGVLIAARAQGIGTAMVLRRHWRCCRRRSRRKRAAGPWACSPGSRAWPSSAAP
jgi:MFS family permease